ncbi:hypothetical protein F5B19DRAFT_404478 [Rostrohypoxylon terebratum]|nr:hypothetical protein F5B19DRAFT_404478 [Rostrohypoxylon terebratum]
MLPLLQATNTTKMARLPRFGLVMKNLGAYATPNNINLINRRSQFSTTLIHAKPTHPSPFDAKRAIPTRIPNRDDVEQTKLDMTLENFHKGVYGHYIDNFLGEGGPKEHLETLRWMVKRLVYIRETLEAQIETYKNEGDTDLEVITRRYRRHAIWSMEVVSSRLAEVEAYAHGLDDI